jgi:hypothetical protein
MEALSIRSRRTHRNPLALHMVNLASRADVGAVLEVSLLWNMKAPTEPWSNRGFSVGLTGFEPATP